MEFRHPAFSLLILTLPALWMWSRRKPRAAFHFWSVEGLEKIPPSWRQLLNRLLPTLRYVILILFILALARPQKATHEREHETQGVDIVISLDISGSMLAEDFQPENRLGVAKEEAKKFIKGRENDRIGLVVF